MQAVCDASRSKRSNKARPTLRVSRTERQSSREAAAKARQCKAANSAAIQEWVASQCRNPRRRGTPSKGSVKNLFSPSERQTKQGENYTMVHLERVAGNLVLREKRQSRVSHPPCDKARRVVTYRLSSQSSIGESGSGDGRQDPPIFLHGPQHYYQSHSWRRVLQHCYQSQSGADLACKPVKSSTQNSGTTNLWMMIDQGVFGSGGLDSPANTNERGPGEGRTLKQTVGLCGKGRGSIGGGGRGG